MSNSSRSIYKTFLLLVLASATLMAGVFVYHGSRHKNPETIIPPDIGFIFPVAREIKPFELISGDNKKFSQKNFYDHWTLLFFGFTHCSSICPTTLDLLNKVYQEIHLTEPRLQVVLISLDPERDTPNKLLAYTQSFNQSFIGATGKIDVIRKLQSQLGIFSNRNGNEQNYQLEHTSSILLINPAGKWTGLFKSDIPSGELSKAFKKSVQFLSQN